MTRTQRPEWNPERLVQFIDVPTAARLELLRRNGDLFEQEILSLWEDYALHTTTRGDSDAQNLVNVTVRAACRSNPLGYLVVLITDNPTLEDGFTVEEINAFQRWLS